MNREKTFLENQVELKLKPNEILAGKYRINACIGKTSFSRVYSAQEIGSDRVICLKVIAGEKTYLDQSIEEIKMMRVIAKNCDLERCNLLGMIDCFYAREHLVIVTELLQENLYDFHMQRRHENFFTKPRIKMIAHQVLTALEALHALNIIHCDLKPENVLFQSSKDCKVKLIDFGSCCYIHDEPAFYMQTRPYRAPEMLLGCIYDERIDIWSLGCMLLELYLGISLFECKSVPAILAKMIAVFGPFPEWMIKTGTLVKKVFTKDLMPFHEVKAERLPEEVEYYGKRGASMTKTEILVPMKINVNSYFSDDDGLLMSFIFRLLEVDPIKR